jgi:pimeloyl-ACP methyl ester carboxylesterase
MSRGLAYILSLIAALGLGCPAEAQGIKFQLPAGSEISAAIDKLPAGEQGAIRQAAAEVFPLFVFIPGIMGSRLTKTLADGSEKVIWGRTKTRTIFSAPDIDLAYSEADKIKAEVMDEYFVAGTSLDIYGSALQSLRFIDLSTGDNVRLFAYDWRQSNKQSARDFAAWLCRERAELSKRSIVLLAHSMGGLVLRSWLKDIYDSEGCQKDEKFSDWLATKKIFFLGTPHYGAPKAVMAFADQYSLLVDPDATMSGLLGGLDAATFSKSINAFGATFPSAYELLPAVNGNPCFSEPSWPYPVHVKQANGTVHTNIDLFNAGTWSVLKWPKSLGQGIDRAKFTSEKLPGLLEAARKFHCELRHYQPDAKFDVVRVSGNGSQTICSVMVNQPATAGGEVSVEPRLCKEGDGTVPKWVAAEDRRTKADKGRSSAKGHMHLVGSPEFIEYLESYRNELHRELQKQYSTKAGNLDGLVTMYASLRSVVPSAASLDTSDVTSQIARRVVDTLGVAPTEIYAAAKSETDPLARATAYRVFADVTGPQDPQRAWALNNAAHIYLAQKNFVFARDLGKQAVKTDNESRTLELIKGRAGITTAIAAEQLNDLTTANAFRSLALERKDYNTMKGILF